MLNKVVVMGRFTDDPELKNTNSGTSVCSFTLACDRDYKDKDTNERATDWIDCVAWRQTAEFVCKYFAKGRMAVAEGRLQTRTYKDKDGNNRKATELVVDNIYFGDSKKDDSASNNDFAPVTGGYDKIPF